LLTAGMALLLGVVGIYGVTSYAISQRTREIGIRLALGARGPTLTRMVVLEGLKLAALGALCGLGAAFGLSRLLAALLFGWGTADPATFALVAVTLLSAATIASYLPARRITKVDPVEALRAESDHASAREDRQAPPTVPGSVARGPRRPAGSA